MNAPSEDIKDLLDADSTLGLAFRTNLFVGEMPVTPDECVCVYDTGGYPPEENFTYQRPTVQIRVRGSKGAYLAGHGLIQSVRDSLHARHNETINGCRFIAIWTESDVGFIAFDDNHRPLFSVNMRIHRADA